MEKIEEKNISEELNKLDELKTVDNAEYANLLNKKINKFKNELDSIVNKIEENKQELIQYEKKFNNFNESLNISEKVINGIKHLVKLIIVILDILLINIQKNVLKIALLIGMLNSFLMTNFLKVMIYQKMKL